MQYITEAEKQGMGSEANDGTAIALRYQAQSSNADY